MVEQQHLTSFRLARSGLWPLAHHRPSCTPVADPVTCSAQKQIHQWCAICVQAAVSSFRLYELSGVLVLGVAAYRYSSASCALVLTSSTSFKASERLFAGHRLLLAVPDRCCLIRAAGLEPSAVLRGICPGHRRRCASRSLLVALRDLMGFLTARAGLVVHCRVDQALQRTPRSVHGGSDTRTCRCILDVSHACLVHGRCYFGERSPVFALEASQIRLRTDGPASRRSPRPLHCRRAQGRHYPAAPPPTCRAALHGR